MRNLNVYSTQIRWTDMKDYLTKRKLSITEKQFNEIAKSKVDKQSYIELKLIFNLKVNFTSFKKIKRKILKGYTYSKYVEDNSVALEFKREKYYEIEKDILTGLQEIVLSGKELKLPMGLEIIQLVKVDRNFKKAVVNWGESNKRKKYLIENNISIAQCIGYDAWQNPIFTEGEKWLVYYTDDFYPMFKIVRPYTKFTVDNSVRKVGKNKAIFNYDFVLSKGTKLTMRKLVAENKIDIRKLDYLNKNAL